MCLPSVELRPAMKLSYLEPRRGNTKNEHNRRDRAGGRDEALLSASSPSHSCQSMVRKILQK